VIFESICHQRGINGIRPMRNRADRWKRSMARASRPVQHEGTPHGLELLEKPDLRTFDRLGVDGAKNAGGTSMAAGFAPGYAARCSPTERQWTPSRGN